VPGKILILGILDKRGEEAAFTKSCIEKNGFQTILMDLGREYEPQIQADITREQVIESGGCTLATVKTMPRDEGQRIVIKGAIPIVRKLYKDGTISGIIALGGTTTGNLTATIVRGLPFGIPKFIVSSAAATRAGGKAFGTNDITMMHSVVSIAGLNSMVKEVLTRAAGGICGMAAANLDTVKPAAPPKASVAITLFGLTERCLMYVRQHLEDKGYEVITFHAQGTGDKVMDDLIDKGRFQAVIDIVPRRLSEQIFGGMMAAGENAFEAAGRRGIPQIIAPGGLNLLSAWGHQTQYNDRKTFAMDDLRRLVLLNKEEVSTIARGMADKLNKASGPVKILVPLRGWSGADPAGSPLFDTETYKAFADAMRNSLKPGITVKEVDAWLEEPKFGQEMLKAFEEVMEG